MEEPQSIRYNLLFVHVWSIKCCNLEEIDGYDLAKYGYSYSSLAENLAGNSTNTGAVNAWMNSEGHRANILSNNYNYTGIGVVNSPKYGKILTQMFIGK